MIRDSKLAWFRSWFARHSARRIARAFEVVYVRGAADVRALLAAGPVVCVSNHVSWWDGLVALVVSDRVLGADGYALMEQANLERLPFFALAGALGVDRASSMDGARALKHASTLLDRPGRLLWIFAQGRERASTVDPLGFEGGAAAVARMTSASVVPIALRYEPGPTSLPRLFVDFGEPLTAGASNDVESQERAVRALLARSGAALASDDLAAYEVFSRARNSRLQRVLERALAMITRPLVRGYSSRS